MEAIKPIIKKELSIASKGLETNLSKVLDERIALTMKRARDEEGDTVEPNPKKIETDERQRDSG